MIKLDKEVIKKQRKIAKLIKKWTNEKPLPSDMTDKEYSKWLKKDKIKLR
jgi:hypothetical protein